MFIDWFLVQLLSERLPPAVEGNDCRELQPDVRKRKFKLDVSICPFPWVIREHTRRGGEIQGGEDEGYHKKMAH